MGCYTSQVRIKQKHRLLENELFSLEKMASTASVQDLMEYPAEEIQDALHDLMISEFHDILPGSSIEPVEETAIQMMDHGLEIVSRVKLKAFFALASGQRKAREGEIPIFVYNHHPFKVKTLIEGEFNLPDFKSKDTFTDVEVYHEGRLLPCQVDRHRIHGKDLTGPKAFSILV